MTGRYGTNRADGGRESNRTADGREPPTHSPTDSDAHDAVDETPAVSEDQRREWRQWIIETVTTGTASVVPVSYLIETVDEREPGDISRSQVQTVLIHQVLPTIENEPGLEYDVDRQVVVNYSN